MSHVHMHVYGIAINMHAYMSTFAYSCVYRYTYVRVLVRKNYTGDKLITGKQEDTD